MDFRDGGLSTVNLKIVVNIINNQQRGNPQVIFSNVQHQEPMKKKREGRSAKLPCFYLIPCASACFCIS